MIRSTVLIIVVLFGTMFTYSQSINYEVYALKFAEAGRRLPISTFALNGPKNDSINIFFMIWLIRGDNGKNILVDAGFNADIKEAASFRVIKYVRPDSTLFKLGLRPDDITDIILTHPHWDHIDGIDLFPKAQIWIQKEEFNYFVGTAWQKGGNKGGFNKRDVYKLIDKNVAGKLTLIDGDDQVIMPGINVFTGSKHTYSTQYALVQTGADKIILASDNIWIYDNLEHMRSAPPNGTSDTIAYVKSMQRMKIMASDYKFIIPGHDPKTFSIFPEITEGVIKIK